MKTDTAYLRHILDAISQIDEYIKDFDREDFLADNKTIDATLMQLEIIGEASNKLSKEFKDKYPKIPFRNMADMRNVVVHDYFGVVRKTVWNTCKKNLPPLREQIKKSLDEIVG
ncbi:MAG: DUF86 domain-containing protein [Candidatus Vogelbacteria bacterium]|nr:DUF86 domain-containing protein [Candidatus Vogelbacteria bacterium]